MMHSVSSPQSLHGLQTVSFHANIPYRFVRQVAFAWADLALLSTVLSVSDERQRAFALLLTPPSVRLAFPLIEPSSSLHEQRATGVRVQCYLTQVQAYGSGTNGESSEVNALTHSTSCGTHAVCLLLTGNEVAVIDEALSVALRQAVWQDRILECMRWNMAQRDELLRRLSDLKQSLPCLLCSPIGMQSEPCKPGMQGVPQ